MNTKTPQNLQKGIKDLHSKNNSKQATGKLMDNIFSNMKSHTKKPTQQANTHGMPIHQQSKLEPEYLNNILIDLKENKFKSTKPHKSSNAVKPTTEKPQSPSRTSPSLVHSPSLKKSGSPAEASGKSPTRKPVPTLVNSVLSKTEKRPKSSMKRRLKKLIGYKEHSADEQDQKDQTTSAHSSKQIKQTKQTDNVQTTKEDASPHVHNIYNHEQSINNNSNSIAENKCKKTKKDTKKIDTKEQKISYTALIDKKPVKSKTKTFSKKKNPSDTNCPAKILAKTSVQSSQQSKKIKLLVNQIASNLKQTSCFELNTGKIKRDIYIKGLSTCMTSQALDQINRILNPPRVAAYRANISTNKNNNNNNTTLLKSNNLHNAGAEDKTKNISDLSKLNIANEINTFNKASQQQQELQLEQQHQQLQQLQHQHHLQQQQQQQQSPGSPPKTQTEYHRAATPTPVDKTIVVDHDGDKTKDVLLQSPKDKEKSVSEKNVIAEVPPLNGNLPVNDQEEELIKKINEKIDKIITTGLNELDEVDTSTSSLTAAEKNPEDGTKRPDQLRLPPLPPPPIAPINLKTSVAKNKEPARFMQAPHIKQQNNIPTKNSTTAKTSREPPANESPPKTSQSEPKKITNILTVVRNSEIVNNIKQNTIKVLQNAISKHSTAHTHHSSTASTDNKPKVLEKKPTIVSVQKTPTNDDKRDSMNKTFPLLKQMQISTDNLSKSMNNVPQRTTFKFGPMHVDRNATRKPSRQIGPNITTSNLTTTHLLKNKGNLGSPNRTSSSSTLNLIAALSTSKKFALLSPMEVVQDFVNLVNHAKRNRKTFTICGNFYSLRRAFAERGWIEKMRINIMEDRETWRKIESLSNFELVDGMRNKDYGEKYRRVFLTKLLAGHQVDFYWDYLTNPFAVNNDKIKRTLINRFPYGATRAYTSKHGLTESLRDAHWYCIDGHANIYYPRTYNLSMIEETTSFVEDFRITAVISLLQWIVSNMTTPEKILSASGDVPTSVYNFATIQCHNYIKIKEHRDIDEVIPQAKDYEWEVFLEKFYKIVHNENSFKINERISAELMIEQSKYVLKKVKKYLPNLHLDGYKNMWLLKPNNGSRGCGIHVCRTLKYMMDTINNRKDIKYVVQKYLERPLLIHKTKFDIRQWFLVTCMPNVKVWLYKECYLRFSSQMFDLNKLHESIHLTNNSIQCRYKNNNQRSTSLPEQNMWDSETFKKYLAEIGQPYAWRNNIYKGMKECLIALFMLCQSKMELRINSFELCGADFMLSEDYHPYLIEINSRPALYPSTKITARMCPKVLEDVIKVTVDHARNPKASTGDFELIYTDSFNYSIPRNVNNLYIEGMSYFSKFIEKKPSLGLNHTPIVPTPQPVVKEVKNDSIKKILNIDPGVVKIDVRNTLEKILAVVHNDSNSKDKESPEERNKKFRSMLSEFVSIISNVKNVNEEV